ncbi:Ig-like domain-containing protein [Patescibacteria group bacterium]|jgi:hypothetical protein|nr:Ig-like domain-containing protein [Patescibacteria group bacterium]
MTRLSFPLVALVAAVLLFPAHPSQAQSGAQTINFNASSFTANKYTVKADGIDSAQVNVTVKNTLYGAMVGAAVQLVSDRGTNDEIVVLNATTNSIGRASFLIRSLRNGTSTLTAIVNGQTFPQTIKMGFVQGLALSLPVGALIKIPDDNNVQTLSDTAVYYYASNGKRYVFPNEKVYYTWYPDFNNVRILTIEEMALIPIGGNITYRPASKLVKFQTDPKVYLPTKGGVLRWAKTEDTVREWFGNDWNKNVDDISEAFYVNYTFGEPINGPYDVSLQVIADTARTVNANLGLGNP